jgi:hypothetical protein
MLRSTQANCEVGTYAMLHVPALLSLTIIIKYTNIPQAISSKYYDISSYYLWRPKLPAIIHSPFKTPSNTTLQLENGEMNHVPSNLKKTTPNFHLIMLSERDTSSFCKTTLSAMLLNYPPPTVPQLGTLYKSDEQREGDRLDSTLHYLSNERVVKDEDLVLIVDGRHSWFQLPSDVIVTQYKMLLEDANMRLLKKYGVNKEGFQKFNQTIVFGAQKMCESDDMACKYVPQSILPDNVYGTETGRRISEMPAKFINAEVVMGPAADLKVLYRAALEKLKDGRSQSETVQSIFTTLFGEQQLRRDTIEVREKRASTIKNFLRGGARNSAAEGRLERANFQLSNTTQHEFSVGLDYTHTLFQPLVYATEDELVPLVHDNSTNLSLPTVLKDTKPPFWRPDFAKQNPSPNEKPAYIDKLEFTLVLDGLPSRKVPWSDIPLIQNTYTGAIPAVLLSNPSHPSHPPTANITWNNLWYSNYSRALLRNYFRTPQSPNGYHNSAVGGDRYWDTRGGRGGVWTEAEQNWFPWGEVDGVCGSLAQLKEVFPDGKGVWMHELDEDYGDDGRIKEEQEFRKKKQEEREKDEERRIEKEEEAKKKEKERKEQKEKDDERQKKEEEAKRKEADEMKKKTLNVEE